MGQKQDETEQAKRAGDDFASEQGAEFDARREAYEAAQGNLLSLIDHPEAGGTISEYQGRIKAARKAVARAHKAMMAAWV